MSFIFSERVIKPPLLIGKSPEDPFYVRPGENLTVTAKYAMFGTYHIKLLKHVHNYQTDTNETNILKELDVPRKIVRVFRKSANGGGREYLIKYYFRNITEADLGNYSIIVGDLLDFDPYTFQIAWEKPGLWLSFKITLQFLCF